MRRAVSSAPIPLIRTGHDVCPWGDHEFSIRCIGALMQKCSEERAADLDSAACPPPPACASASAVRPADALIAAATELFLAQGVAQTSIAQIAQKGRGSHPEPSSSISPPRDLLFHYLEQQGSPTTFSSGCLPTPRLPRPSKRWSKAFISAFETRGVDALAELRAEAGAQRARIADLAHPPAAGVPGRRPGRAAVTLSRTIWLAHDDSAPRGRGRVRPPPSR